ncbi:MAG TPA: hypothetical protein VHW09_27565 [Bryobacteraceae bacterium]|nr:hypothetical protein [Bryobacteraceae bacterium]
MADLAGATVVLADSHAVVVRRGFAEFWDSTRTVSMRWRRS